MSLAGNDICLLKVEDFNLYEEDAAEHAYGRESDLEKSHLRGGVKMEAEKRIRREIANSNERRRMQSINAGFQSLRTLLPRHEGEKLSKAAILQQTAEYIYTLEQEKTRLLSQNCQLKRLLNQHEGGEVPLKKRKNDLLHHTASPDSTDDTSRSPDPLRKEELLELRAQLDRERRARLALEDRLRELEAEEVATVAAAAAVATPATATPVVTAAVVAGAPLLEAAIKASPRVEVEVLPDSLYAASTSRQNLETIVEAIRHLEGDHLFSDAPLALTKKEPPPPPPPRPGVIVAKHS